MTTLPEEAVKAAVEAVDEGVNWVAGLFGEKYDNAEEVMRSALAAALPFLPVRGAVKKLEWRKGRAETPFGPYHVIEETNDDEPFWFVMFNGKAVARCGTHDDEESAIFAAQADYERRILSAIEAASPLSKLKAGNARLEDQLAEARKALEPFALVAEHDIGDDETDSDAFRPMPKPFNHAPEITVGHLRAAKRALSSPDHADAGHAQARDVLARFRDYVIEGITAGTIMRGGEHHNPIWQDVAGVLHADAGKVEGDGWLPIESAPKDGTVIDLWSDEYGRLTDCYWGAPMAYEGGETGWVHAHSNEWAESPDEFVHWRPLPSAPASEGAE